MLHPIILYDGVCGLCNRLNQFVLRRDREGTFRFAWLQSPLAARILAQHGANPQDLDTVYVVLNHDLTKQA
jgi:predicted DCC family thiol-disulfide oxidoreductase YuxK